MFNPAAREQAKAALVEKKRMAAQIKGWASALVPVELQEGLQLDVKEVECGDPNCAPIDTVFTLVWQAGGRGMFAVPLCMAEITEELIPQLFPDGEVLQQWFAKEEAHWPRRPEVRFNIGSRVECRVGAHRIKGWAAGEVTALYYSEPGWPQSMYAPYQVHLDDGRLIFAPQDIDEVVRAAGSVTYTAEEMTKADEEEEEEEEYEEEEEECDEEEEA
jgi:hypothetical protein